MNLYLNFLRKICENYGKKGNLGRADQGNETGTFIMHSN